MAKHEETQCDQCGKFDDHPKSHWNNGKTYHFDCLPYDLRRELLDSHPDASTLVEAANSGTHGEELRKISHTLGQTQGE
jgi:hypothetical protein